MADDGSPRPPYYFTEESWDRFTEWCMNPTALRIGPSVFNLTLAENSLCWKMAWKRGNGCDDVYMAREDIFEALEYRPCCFHELHVLPPIENEYRSVKPTKEATSTQSSSCYGEESFHLMGGLIKSGCRC
ncbi:hypothetical protein Bca52824_006733 [Brassica carinata]|uniref:Uncharacterized protein n=1 Tax=Brassica carinata TaxID=52824 RepID=A0A8X7W7U3_BRACI|nr:hypothetical protein Bca52824_006733 [Brassica carinata]